MEVRSMTVQSEALRVRSFPMEKVVDKAAALLYSLVFVAVEGAWIGFLGWAVYKFT
jgi:hypothetical protein